MERWILKDEHRPGLGRSDARQHRHARPPTCRRRSKKNGPQALGRSRGGFGTKIHAVVDALGNPIGFTLTGANLADITEAPRLIEQIQAAGAEAIIPPRSNRKTPRSYYFDTLQTAEHGDGTGLGFGRISFATAQTGHDPGGVGEGVWALRVPRRHPTLDFRLRMRRVNRVRTFISA